MLPLLRYYNFSSISVASAERFFYTSFLVSEVSPNQSPVLALDVVFGKECRQFTVNFFVLCDDEKSGRILIETVDDACAFDTVKSRERIERVRHAGFIETEATRLHVI